MKKLIKKEIHSPLASRILVKVDPPENLPKSGLIVLEHTKDRESTAVDTGVVVSIGKFAFDGFGDGSAWVTVGDKVCFLKHAGAIRKVNGEDYRVLNDVDLLTLITYEEIEEEIENAAAA